jgi:glycosyltransferase involved in cell wall biosynthesis
LLGVHNEGDRLRRTVESILEAKGKLDAEVLVADDGSTDGSIKELKRHFPGLRFWCRFSFTCRTILLITEGLRYS